MRLSRYFMPILRETPKEAEIVSHRLMLRAGMIRQEAAGIYAFLPLGLLFVENVLLVSTLGTTVGHRLLGIRVVAVDRLPQAAPPPLLRSVSRAALLCLFVPALIMNADGRGLHDRAARTVVRAR